MDNLSQDPTFLIGATLVVGAVGLFLMMVAKTNKSPKHKTVLPLEDFVPFPLIRKEILSHDTRRFTFGLPSGHVMGLPTGQHISFQFQNAADNGKTVQRNYTPVTDNTVVGEISFVIKVYRPEPPKFPVGGLMSQHVDSLAIDDSILMKGPKGHMTWKGFGRFTVKPLGKPLEQRQCCCLGLMAGGTGITPMLQILHAIFRYPTDRGMVSVKLLYANQTENDILVRQELDALQKEFPDRFHLWYTIDRVSDDSTAWMYDTGFISKDMISKHLSVDDKYREKTQFFMCGPPPMIKFACIENLKALGYTEKDWVIF